MLNVSSMSDLINLLWVCSPLIAVVLLIALIAQLKIKARATDELRSLKMSFSALEKEKKDLESTKSKHEEEAIGLLNDEIASLKQELDETKHRQLKSAAKRVLELKEEIERLKAEQNNAANEETIGLLNDEIISLKQELDETKHRQLKSESKRILELEEEIERLKTEQNNTDDEKEKKIYYLNKKISLLKRDVEKAKAEQISSAEKKIAELNAEIEALQKKLHARNDYFEKAIKERKTAFPFVAGLAADYLTYDLEVLHKGLEWGSDKQRLKKAKSIKEIRKEANEAIKELKEYEYTLKYLLELYPELQDVIDVDESANAKIDIETDENKIGESAEYSYLTNEEWKGLSEDERNQLALDRYIEGHRKTKWQIGRDYELYIGWLYEKQGWQVEYTGSTMRLEDMGRDLILRKNNNTAIIQCKYWSKTKVIHEKHIFQLYGTAVLYKMEHPDEKVGSKFVTNIKLSPTAKRVAAYLGIQVDENKEIGDFPRIKCNVGKDEFGLPTKKYHLPMDQQYDVVKIEPEKGEFMAFTVAEATRAGFVRAKKWFGGA